MKGRNSLNMFLTLFLYSAILIAGLANLLQFIITQVILACIFLVLIINLVYTNHLDRAAE